MDEIIKSVKEYFSNPDNRQKVLHCIKISYKYIRSKIPLQTTILYIIIIFLMFTIVLRFNINAGHIIRTGIGAINNKLTSINIKRSLVGIINKKEIADLENKILLSDGFLIETEYFTKFSVAHRLGASMHIINNPHIVNDEYGWIMLDVDKEKCKMLFTLFSDAEVNCTTKTLKKTDTTNWINDCPLIKPTTQIALKNSDINKYDSVLLLCGIKDSEVSSFFFLYVGENYSAMQEFKNTVFLEKILPIFKIQKKHIDTNI